MGLGRNRHSPIGATGLKLLGFFGGSLDDLGGLCGAVGVGGDHDVEARLRLAGLDTGHVVVGHALHRLGVEHAVDAGHCLDLDGAGDVVLIPVRVVGGHLAGDAGGHHGRCRALTRSGGGGEGRGADA